ncbi:pyridoxal phosphate-dependent transferase [Podospora australis]|uniref:Pyridoxal phosphate-dependent transferase n=1 Tax=Podospora australis TaxID=1536484 RepID=A0AAN6WWB9_9PEZI|nr:pyridoxal phosphate-dependent transferase [Podospora australis]
MGPQAHIRRFDVKSIAIIGAGPCGLAAAKYLTAQNVFERIDVLEQQSEVGGVWKYSSRTLDNHRVPQVSPECPPDLPLAGGNDTPPIFPSPMYEVLHTNIPRALMPFTDFPFEKDLLIFPSRQDVQDYLVKYSQDIRHLIKFSNQVEDVRLRQADGKDQWDVEVRSLKTQELTSAAYDAVVVASGHYSIVYIPEIKGIADFHKAHPEVISHSKYYRTPGPFTDKKVIVVGNAASGLDIAAQISKVSQKPLLLAVRTATSEANLAYSGAEEVPQIEEFLVDDRAVRFQDGRIEKNIDAVIFATGYLYSFPFLKSLEPPLVPDGRRVRGLYKHLFHIDHPTLVFPGLPMKVVPFPVSQSQAAIFSRIWANVLPLPSVEEMRRWEDEEAENRGSNYHVWPVGGDSEYINSVYDWISRSGTPGKEPPHWSPELVWQRTIHMKAKLQFELEGRKAKSLEELGFEYRPDQEPNAGHSHKPAQINNSISKMREQSDGLIISAILGGPSRLECPPGAAVALHLPQVAPSPCHCSGNITDNCVTMDTPAYRPADDSSNSRPSGDGEKPLPLNFSHHYSEVTKRRLPSKIKAVYKFFQIPGILNVAGGLPNPHFFPFDTLEAQTAKPERWTPTPNYPGEASSAATPASGPAAPTHITVPSQSNEKDLLKKVDLATALQYGMAQGYPPLLSWVRQFTRENLHPNVPYRDGPEVILTNGSTDGFSKALNLFVSEWRDTDDIRDRPGMLCETFVYTNVPNQAMPLGVQMVPVKADESGMSPEDLEDVLANWDPSRGKRPHLMYTVTLGHNPTGVLLSVERKKQIYAICSKYDVIIIEDEPYWYLQFPSAAAEEAKSRKASLPADLEKQTSSTAKDDDDFMASLTPSFTALDVDGRVVRLDTFSKTVAPGCRLGWITAQPALIERFERINEATTQQPSGFVQALVSSLVLGPSSTSSSTSALSRFSLLPASKKLSFKGWQTQGFIRWLAGLRGSYERRMVRMCRILDSGSEILSVAQSRRSDWQIVNKRKLYTFQWPRAGMFVWLRMELESHPLFGARMGNGSPLKGLALSTALMIFLTTKPYRVLVGTGAIFSATEKIREEEGWKYFRLCFAAEEEDNVDLAAERFVDGVHAFWSVRDMEVIEKLLEEVGGLETQSEEEGEQELMQLGGFMGC